MRQNIFYRRKNIHIIFLRRQPYFFSRFSIFFFYINTKDFYFPARNCPNSSNCTNRGRLPCSVFSKKAKKLSLFYRKRNIVNSSQVAVLFCKIGNFKCVHTLC